MSSWRKHSPAFALFWENSVLNKRTIVSFSEAMEADSLASHSAPELLYNSMDAVLLRPEDELDYTMEKRQSARNFSSQKLSQKTLGALFSGFRSHKDGRRILPSAGGKYPIEVFALLFHTEGDLSQKIVYYNADNHSFSVVGDTPEWSIVAPLVGLPNTEEAPAAVVIFAGFPKRTVAKYGDRGGRFFLIEVGAYAQNLALRLAEEKVGGVILGGLFDEDIKKILGLDKTDAVVVLGYACGYTDVKTSQATI